MVNIIVIILGICGVLIFIFHIILNFILYDKLQNSCNPSDKYLLSDNSIDIDAHNSHLADYLQDIECEKDPSMKRLKMLIKISFNLGVFLVICAIVLFLGYKMMPIH